MKIPKMFRFKSIRTVLVLPFIVSFLIATGLMAAVIFNDSQKALNSVLVELRKAMIALVVNDLDNKLDQIIQLNHINNTALENRLLRTDAATERERYFIMMLRNYPEVVMTYIGLPDGQFYGARRNTDGTLNVVRNNESTQNSSVYYSVDSTGAGLEPVQVFENFDPRKRPWYITATASKELTFSPLYSHFVFKEPTLTASLPVYDGERLVGVLGVDYLMTWLGSTLNNLPIGTHGQVFIVDENRQLVATTTGEPVFKLVGGKSVSFPAAESSNPVTKKIMELSQKQANQESATIEVEGDSYIYGVDLYQRHGITWHIYTVMERDDLLSEMNRTTVAAVQTILILTAFFIVYAFIMTQQIVKPIIQMNESAKKLSEGIFEPVQVSKRRDELGELTESFNEMGSQLSEMVEHLEEEVELRTAQLEEKNTILKTLSYVDELAQIANRRKFDEFFKQTLELSSRNKRPIGLMMLDIDNFKKFNDLYGHVAGDHTIQAVGSVLRQTVHRSSDLTARYGGEEFVVVLQEITSEAVHAMAEAIRAGIQALDIPHEETEWRVVTVSIGVVYGTVGVHQSPDDIVHQADEALYEAKSQGRNAIVFSEIHQAVKETP